MATPLIQLRNKYADDIEEILQCPVCYENMAGTVLMCTQGHAVCEKCQLRVSNCPLCQNAFRGTRNFLAESLAAKFEEIKVSLTDPANIINKKVFKDKLCIETQTEEIYFLNNKNVIDFKTPPPDGKGKFACRIIGCSEKLAHGRMIPHLRYYHRSNLIEEENTNDSTYSRSWVLIYKMPGIFNVALCIPNMGIFFLIVTINNHGDVFGSLQIINKVLIAKKFQYTLEIQNTVTSYSYKGQVLGNRSPDNNFHENSLCVNSKSMAYLLKKKEKFICRLTINRESL